MPRIALISMPFSIPNTPSLALTQLKAVVKERLGEAVKVEVHYLNHAFLAELGMGLYRLGLVAPVLAREIGFGEWFFRQEAFPDLEDNTEAYVREVLRPPADEAERLIVELRQQRAKLGPLMEGMIDRYGLDRCVMVGFASTFMQNVASLAMARRLKGRCADIVTVIGGANCQPPMGQVIARRAGMIDFVFCGAALETFPTLLGHVLSGEAERCHGIAGVLSRRRLAVEGESCAMELGAERDLNRLLTLDFGDHFQSVRQHLPNGNIGTLFIPFETSRGCWWGQRSHCAFCGVDDRSLPFRAMAPEVALEQFRQLFRYVPEVQQFTTTDCILSRDHLRNVIPHLKAPAGTALNYEVRAELSVEELRTLRAAGVTGLQPGIESLRTRQLKTIGKGLTGTQNIRFLKNCVVAGVSPTYNLLFGLPGDDAAIYDHYVKAMPALAHLCPPGHAVLIRYLRYSPLMEQAERFGLELAPAEFYRFVYPFDEHDLRDVAFYFDDARPDVAQTRLALDRLPAVEQEIRRWKRRHHGADGGPPALLTMQEDDVGPCVYDSRFGEVVCHRPPPQVLVVMGAMALPVQRDRIDALASGLSKVELQDAMGWLDSRHMLYHDDGRCISLVIDPAEGHLSGATAERREIAGSLAAPGGAAG